MADFDLDLQAVEDRMDDEAGEGTSGRVVLGVLDGGTPDEEWLADVESGAVLVLAVEGDPEYLAAGFVSQVREMGGELIHFREFLIVTPPGVGIDADRLG